MTETSKKSSGGRDSDAAEEDDVDFFDSVELEEMYEAMNFEIRDTTGDKLIFTVMLTNALLTCYLAGYAPNYFYLWHTLKFSFLIPYRWYTYKQEGQHYFLFDFCYFTNFLILIYVWSDVLLSWKLGWLFPIIYSFSLGPVLFGIVAYRNSLVPHSLDKMTSVFIHSSPIATVYGLKWYSTDDQGFELCYNATSPGINGCDHVGWIELLLLPSIIFAIWLCLYGCFMFRWKAKRIQEKEYLTAYKYMAIERKKTMIYKLMNICGPKYNKVAFLGFTAVYTLLGIISAYFAYFSMTYLRVIIGVMLFIASYNGASFYIDVYGRKYYDENKKKHY